MPSGAADEPGRLASTDPPPADLPTGHPGPDHPTPAGRPARAGRVWPWVAGGTLAALLLLACSGLSGVLLNLGVAHIMQTYGVWDGKVDPAAAAAARASCDGQSYLGPVPDTDYCADVQGQVIMDRLTLTATQLRRDARDSVCSTVSYQNATGDDIRYSPADWRLQSPGGAQASSFQWLGGDSGAVPQWRPQEESDLGEGNVVDGGRVTGKVCFPPTRAGAGYALIYAADQLSADIWEDEPASARRGIWIKEVPAASKPVR
ncbi:hypothetical protein [Pilimelia columellifera]|uniref:DUF4352 domain-containing protein n=1 Tax=Pilimelia columellifera subsp. columellifera TaxID=706583 RepID=A0ABP6AF80_9ACTN